jgi:hypothetical protein
VIVLFFAARPRFFAWACCRLVCAAALRPAARFAVLAPVVFFLVWAFVVARRPPAFFATILICTAFFLLAAVAWD